jgi:hypothetical protein
MIASSAPTDSATVRLALVPGSVMVASNDDGPVDGPVVNPEPILLSTELLLASLQITPAASTVDSPVTATMRVRNLHPTETLIDVMPSALLTTGLGSLDPVDGPTPAQLTLAPDEEAEFTWTYRAASSGEVHLGGAVSGTEEISGVPHQSLSVTSNAHQIFVQAQDLDVFAVQSMPFSISRGQQGVVPLSLTFENPAGIGGSDILLQGLKIRLEDESGGDVIPADLLSRVVVNEGAVVYLDKTALETSGAEIDLTLAQPVTIQSSGASSSVTLAIALDISESTSVPNFRLVLQDPTWIQAQDATSGGPVNVDLLDPPTFPVTSGLARVVAEATQVDIASVPMTDRAVGQGQDDVTALSLLLDNPDPSGLAADARVTAFVVELVDTLGVRLPDAMARIDRIVVQGPSQVHLDRAIVAADSVSVSVALAPLVSIPVNTPVPITVRVDIANGSAIGPFRVQLADAGTFEARDANTGSPLPAIYATDPVIGPLLSVQAPAPSTLIGSSPRLPGRLPVGSLDVPAIELTLTHPGPAEAGPIRIDSVLLQSRGGSNQPLASAAVLDAARVLADGAPAGEIASVPGTDSFVVQLSDVVLAPFESVTLEARLDVEVSAPATLFQVTVPSDGVIAVDANLATPVGVVPQGGTEFPLSSGVTQLQAPARDLLVELRGQMPPVLAADGGTVGIGTLSITNPAAPSSGAIRMSGFELLSAAPDLSPQDAGLAISEVNAWSGDVLWATTGPLDGAATAQLVAADTLSIGPDETVDLRLEMTLLAETPVAGVRLGLTAAGLGVVQPGSPLLSVSVLPADGASFPMWTESGNFSGVSLAESYSNFPNPFAAGREETAIAFYLAGAGRVSLKVYSLRGEPVCTLLDEASLGEGLHQDVTWDGRNGRGSVVRNGVYLAELVVTFDDGGSERRIRKMAVVR